MDRNTNDLSPQLEEQWREWSATRPAIDERQLERILLEGMPGRRPHPRARLLLVAAAVSLVAVLIGIESSQRPVVRPPLETSAAVYETGDNVILVLREDGEPIYVLTEASAEDIGE